MLQMAANPEYVRTKSDEDENGDTVEFPAIDEEIIFIDAEALANEAEKRMDKPFDEISDSELIAEKLDDIEEEMEREFDIEHNID